MHDATNNILYNKKTGGIFGKLFTQYYKYFRAKAIRVKDGRIDVGWW